MAGEDQRTAEPLLAGRYVLGEPFASGGMGSVHIGRIVGSSGFSRVVAIKRLFPGFAGDASFRQMLLDEARFASRIRHPNVVPILDVVEDGRDLYVIMEYVHGLSLAEVLERRQVPADVAVAIAASVLLGLHAAHEARDEDGVPLGIVHRDVSPQNVLIGADGVPRLIDFGIAKAATRAQVTDPGVIKGKAGYMAPETLLGEAVARTADVFSASVVLWEMLSGCSLFPFDVSERIARVAEPAIPPSRRRPELERSVDAVVLRGLERDPARRFPTAEAMAFELQHGRTLPSVTAVARWLGDVAADDLEVSEERVRLFEQGTRPGSPDSSTPAALVTSAAPASTAALEVGGRRHGRAIRVAMGIALAGAAWLVFALGPWRRAPAVLVPGPVAASAALSPPPMPSSSVPLPEPAVTASGAARVSGPARPAASHRSSRSKCDPPYTVDGNGFKHYDPSCF